MPTPRGRRLSAVRVSCRQPIVACATLRAIFGGVHFPYSPTAKTGQVALDRR